MDDIYRRPPDDQADRQAHAGARQKQRPLGVVISLSKQDNAPIRVGSGNGLHRRFQFRLIAGAMSRIVEAQGEVPNGAPTDQAEDARDHPHLFPIQILDRLRQLRIRHEIRVALGRVVANRAQGPAVEELGRRPSTVFRFGQDFHFVGGEPQAFARAVHDRSADAAQFEIIAVRHHPVLVPNRLVQVPPLFQRRAVSKLLAEVQAAFEVELVDRAGDRVMALLQQRLRVRQALQRSEWAKQAVFDQGRAVVADVG